MRTCIASRSSSEYTATVVMPSSRHVRMTRTAISPRLAIRTLVNMDPLRSRSGCPGVGSPYPTAMARGVDTSDDAAQGPRWRVSHFEELDSTNRWALDRAREGAPEGLVVVADHQTAGRGRLDRRW